MPASGARVKTQRHWNVISVFFWMHLDNHHRGSPPLPAYEPSFGARPVPGRSGSDSLLVPEPSPSRRLHSDPLRAGTSRAPDAGGVRGARGGKKSGRSLPDRKSTRLNSSHGYISYSGFYLY